MFALLDVPVEGTEESQGKIIPFGLPKVIRASDTERRGLDTFWGKISPAESRCTQKTVAVQCERGWEVGSDPLHPALV